jgi:hypothetical protein
VVPNFSALVRKMLYSALPMNAAALDDRIPHWLTLKNWLAPAVGRTSLNGYVQPDSTTTLAASAECTAIDKTSAFRQRKPTAARVSESCG